MNPEPRAAVHRQLPTRTLGVSITAGIIAGGLVGGVGGRIVMRISAIAADADGVITEGGNRVGDITVGGTLALIIFGGIFSGIAGGLLLFVLRPWLPDHPVHRAAVLAVVLPMIAAAIVIAPESSDFLLLDPPGLNVALFLALFVAFGPVVTLAETIVDRHIPQDPAQDGTRGDAVTTVAVVLGPAALLAFVFLADELPLVSLSLLLIGVATVLRTPGGVARWHLSAKGASLVAYGALLGACAAGAWYLVQHVNDIH